LEKKPDYNAERKKKRNLRGELEVNKKGAFLVRREKSKKVRLNPPEKKKTSGSFVRGKEFIHAGKTFTSERSCAALGSEQGAGSLIQRRLRKEAL